MSTQKAAPSNKFILIGNNRGLSMYLGCINQSFAIGSVMEMVNDKLHIDGKPYDDSRDFEILKRHGWAVPYTKELHQACLAKRVAAKPVPKIKPEEKEVVKHRHMEVIESDSDLNEDIDIRHTKTAQKQPIDKKAPLEVIRGDESAEDRIKRLQTEIPKMPIVEDESVNADGRPSLNAGQIKTIPPEKLAQSKAEAARIAESYRIAAARAKAAKAVIAQAQAKAGAEVVAATETEQLQEQMNDVNQKPDVSSTVSVVENDFSVQSVEQAATEEATGISEGLDTAEMFETTPGITNTGVTTPKIAAPVKVQDGTPPAPAAEAKRGRGRPKGSKNKVAAQ